MRKLVAGLLVATFITIASVFAGSGHAVAAEPGCDEYAIMRCGANTPARFIEKTNINNAGDLKTIYAKYGLKESDYQRFASSAKQGTIYDDGRIVVDGVTVGTSTQNVGRVQTASFNQAVNIGGKTYWGGSFGSTYHADSAAVTVLFNDQGVMQFVSINECGNPQTFTPNGPKYSCDKLKKTPIAGQNNTYQFTTKASATQGATLSKAVYDFGDGTSQTVTDLSQAVNHTFTKDSTVKVTVYVKVPGGSEITAVSADCMTQVTFVAPPAPTPPAPTPETPTGVCSRLDAIVTDEVNRAYRFTAVATLGGGVTFKSADFNFGDGVTMTGIRPNANTAIIDHSYGAAGQYTVTATVHFANPDGTDRASVSCQTSTNPKDATKYCKPGIVEGSADCQELTKTGAGTIGFGLFAGIGTLAGAGHWVIRRRLGL